ncbi:hypothetical protein [Flavobacterium ajazii]|uniref:hypothetical protein n=1 Tax=Flavobacterium ajazii TaxID=2692318 RepID=UPI0013D004C1|nr:hypothetical protein [Flavobacterium ajazii]
MSRFVFFALLLLFYGCKDSSREQIVDFKRTILEQKNVFTVPKKLKDNFLQKFPTLEMIKKEDYSNLFWDFYDRNMIPSECYTDINNDQILDYALLVKDGDKLKLGIIFSSDKDYSYWISPFSIENVNSGGVNFCVSVKPAGRTDVVKKAPESLVIKKNGFLLRNLEQDSFIFYETNGEIKTFKML